jgi:hypothetical protein
MKPTILLLLSLLLLTIKAQDPVESGDSYSSEGESSESAADDGVVTVDEIAQELNVQNQQSDDIVRNADQQQSLTTVLAALENFRQNQIKKGEDPVIVTESGTEVTIEEASSFNESCISRVGSALRKVNYDPQFNLDTWERYHTNDNDANCLLNNRLLCQSMWKISRPPYWIFYPAQDYAWGERSLIASPEGIFGCHITIKEIGTFLCQYWFGAGWEWHRNKAGRYMQNSFGTQYSYSTWPLDDNTPGKLTTDNDYRTLSNINAQPNEPFWVQSETDRTCYIPV